MKMSTLPHRRIFLAACIAVGIASAARPGHSAEIERRGPRWAPDPRPWADFLAAKDTAEKRETTPAGVEATMLAILGPLPWRFTSSPWGACVVTKLAPMADPSDEREATGVWAVIRYMTTDERGGVVLQQVGKLRLTLGKRAQIVVHGWQLSDLYGTDPGVIWYEHLPDAVPLRKITISGARYHEAVSAMVADLAKAAAL